jgi:hypothetical protein
MSEVTILHGPACGIWSNDSGFVLDILPAAQRAAFANEDGQAVVDAEGRRVAR